MANNINFSPFISPQEALGGGYGLAETSFRLNLFSSSGRIGRIRYFTYSIWLTFLIVLVAGILESFVWKGSLALSCLALLYVNAMLAIKRCHDFNASAWMALLAFVPLLNLALLFVPGTDGPNRFGLKTAPNGNTTEVGIVVLVGILFMGGVLGAVALPAYKQYSDRIVTAGIR